MQQAREEEEARLREQARRDLDTVVVQGNQAFNALLALAIRNTLRAYALRNGGRVLVDENDGTTMELEIELDH